MKHNKKRYSVVHFGEIAGLATDCLVLVKTKQLPDFLNNYSEMLPYHALSSVTTHGNKKRAKDDLKLEKSKCLSLNISMDFVRYKRHRLIVTDSYLNDTLKKGIANENTVHNQTIS